MGCEKKLNISESKIRTKVCLTSLLNRIIVDIMPLHDRQIIIEMLLSHLKSIFKVTAAFRVKKCKDIYSISSYTNVSETEEVSDSNAFMKYILNKTKPLQCSILPTNIYKEVPTLISKHNVNSLLLLPIQSFEEIQAIICIDTKNDLDESETSFFSSIIYYLITAFDRITQIERLETLLDRVEELNMSSQIMNASLTKELKINQSLTQRLKQKSLKKSYEATLSTLCLGLAHEINNPLTIVHMDTEFIKDDERLTELDKILPKIAHKYGLDVNDLINTCRLFLEKKFNKTEFEKMFMSLLAYSSFNKIQKECFCSEIEAFILKKRFLQFADSVELNLHKVNVLTSTIMKYGVSRSAEKKVIDIHDLIQDISLMITGSLKKSGIKLLKKFSAETVSIHANHIRLNQAVLNLIQNSIEAFSLKNTNKWIELSYSMDRSSTQKNYVCLKVSDNAKGVSKADLLYIFNPFFHRKKNTLFQKI